MQPLEKRFVAQSRLSLHAASFVTGRLFASCRCASLSTAAAPQEKLFPFMNATRLRRFFAELKRRSVYKVAAAYAVGSWFLIQLVSTVAPPLGAPLWLMRVLLVVLGLGFPIALVLAWAFDLTPAGIRRTDGPSPNEKLPRRVGRKLTALIVVLGLLAAGLFWFRSARLTDSAPSDHSIAVLPLVNQSEAKEEYFADGLTDELINGLGKIRQLRVIGRNSSFHFKDRPEDSRAIGQALGVEHLLEGSVRKSGDRVRITVSLVRTSDGSQVWSQNYDRELKDIFAVQEEMARAVADQLRIELLAIDVPVGATPSNKNIEAYNAYLRGEFYYSLFTEASSRQAVEAFAEALRLDPKFTEAYAGTAMAWNRIGYFEGADGSGSFEQARVAAQKAIALDPNAARAHAALGYLHMNADWDLARAEKELAQSDQRSPNVIHTLALVRDYQGRLEEAITLEKQAIVLDPAFSLFQTNLGSFLLEAGRYDEAEQALRKAIDLQPHAPTNHYFLALIALARQRLDDALREARTEGSGPHRLMALALVQSARGAKVEAEKALEHLVRSHGEDSPARVASVYALRREPEKAFAWLKRALALHDPRLIYLRADTFFQPYHRDPRFIRALPQDWSAHFTLSHHQPLRRTRGDCASAGRGHLCRDERFVFRRHSRA